MENEEKDHIKNENTGIEIDESWAEYTHIHHQTTRFTRNSEFYWGHFGNYFPDKGYMKDFYMYDNTTAEYKVCFSF